MSSIAYVTDENMVEYHRLCGSRQMNFWRLSSRAGFSDFRRGDLLFFYARRPHMRSRGFLGYAHYVSTASLSVRQMWKRYGSGNGYETIQDLKEAIRHAARDHQIPEKLNCLYLNDAVFFREAVYPEEVGIEIDRNLESYQYLDVDDPQVTVRILKKAEEKGINLWSAVQSYAPDNIFRLDEVRHQLAQIVRENGPRELSHAEQTEAVRLTGRQVRDRHYELIRGSQTDAFRLQDQTLYLMVPFVCRHHDRSLRLKEYLGTLLLFKWKIREMQLPVRNLVLEGICSEEEPELTAILKVLNTYE